MELLSSGSSLRAAGCSCPLLEREPGSDARSDLSFLSRSPMASHRLVSLGLASTSLLLPTAELVFNPSNQPHIQGQWQWQSWVHLRLLCPLTSRVKNLAGLGAVQYGSLMSGLAL